MEPDRSLPVTQQRVGSAPTAAEPLDVDLRIAAADADTLPTNGAPSNADDLLHTLYVEHWQAVLTYAKRFTSDHGRAEDIVQETFMRAWRHLPALLADDRPVRPWLLRVARRLLIDAARAARVRPLIADGSLSQEPAVDDRVEQILDRSLLRGAMRQLSPAQRQIVVETFFCGTPVGEVAARLGVPAGTARSRLHYALHRLRQQLEPVTA